MKEFDFPLSVTLNFSRITIRELSGQEELILDPRGTRGILQLLNDIMIRTGYASDSPLKAESIAVSDRDNLLCEIFKFTYGPKITSTMHCSECKLPYDLDFNLDELVSHTHNQPPAYSVETDAEGYFTAGKKYRFRLPTGEDELAISGMNPRQAGDILLSRCLSQTATDENQEEIEGIMESLGPVMMTNMAVNCPECGAHQQVNFDIQSYFLAKMNNERSRVAAEIHLIASAHKWSHTEILNLPRSLRQMYAELLGMN